MTGLSSSEKRGLWGARGLAFAALCLALDAEGQDGSMRDRGRRAYHVGGSERSGHTRRFRDDNGVRALEVKLYVRKKNEDCVNQRQNRRPGPGRDQRGCGWVYGIPATYNCCGMTYQRRQRNYLRSAN